MNDADDNDVRCPKCNGTDFSRYEGGDYTERHTIDTTTLNEDFDKQETNMMHAEPWRCWSCDLVMPDDIQEAIEEMR